METGAGKERIGKGTRRGQKRNKAKKRKGKGTRGKETKPNKRK